MLKNLYIKNYALLDEVQVEFEKGLNIITGETGAGKSIIIDALSTILGEKADLTALREGTDKAVIEGFFSIQDTLEVANYLQDLELEDEGRQLIVRREILKSGRSRAFINDTPVPFSVLEQLGELLVDLHGQHEHQSLLRVNQHLLYLDDYGGYPDLLKSVETSYNELVKLKEQLTDLRTRATSLQQKKDLFEFQIREISVIDPQPGEEEELLKEEKILQNSEKLFQMTSSLYQSLYETQGSVYERLSEAQDQLEELAGIDERFKDSKRDCESARIIIDELAKFLQGYNSGIEFNPQRLEQIRERLAQFSRLKKKYSGSIEDILEQKAKLEQELNLIENLDEEIDKLEALIREKGSVLSDACEKLSDARKKAAQDLERAVVEVLSQLGMSGAQFQVMIERREDDQGLVERDGKRYRTTAKGMDLVEFYISANPGESPKPLAKVASGGEISRIMLALKSILAHSDRIPILIFDEIDLGISGRIAQAVGRSLKQLAQSHQIICITHLPQIASMGNYHFMVEKTSDGISTRTCIKKLNSEERALAIAKLLGGEKLTESHIKSAEELLKEAQL